MGAEHDECSFNNIPFTHLNKDILNKVMYSLSLPETQIYASANLKATQALTADNLFTPELLRHRFLALISWIKSNLFLVSEERS